MDIKIMGEHLSITQAISNYITEKFSHIPSPDKLNQVEFRIGKLKENQYVHFYAHCLQEDIIIKTENTDLYQAIDQIMGKIQRHFIKMKEKHNLHLHVASAV